jgi:hypothetical protein
MNQTVKKTITNAVNNTLSEFVRYSIFISPILIVSVYYLIIIAINLYHPILLASLTIYLYFFAVYPLEIEKLRTLTVY